MQFAELSLVRHRIQPGSPLPFNVRNADLTLLLARGQFVDSDDHLESLFQRGALVDLSEVLQADRAGAASDVSVAIAQASRDALPGLWNKTLDRVGQVLQMAPDAAFTQALHEAAGPVQQLIDKDPDLAIFQVLQQGANPDRHYGALRSIQSAITSLLVAHRLDWQPEQAERAFKTALTMNLSMLELQGQLARQSGPPNAAQREEIHSHPERSAHMLRLAGISDALWLRAVEHHHESEDGNGYPEGRSDIDELARLVRRADIYTAMLASRATRRALPADLAARQMFMRDPGQPTTSALVKEFGIYPPGCQVKLASGETAMVIERGATITTPLVVSLTDARGQRLRQPLRRDTAIKPHAVQGIVSDGALKNPPSLQDMLLALAR